MILDRLRRILRRAAVATLFATVAAAANAADQPLRVGVLKFGTVNWQLATLQEQGNDVAEGIALEVLALASNNATAIALQADEVDLIVSDWIWALRQRAAGEALQFVPYSNALGALVLAADNPARDIAGLKGQHLGIAGGPLDKSWLVLRAFSQATSGFDLAEAAEVVYAAPPLLAEQVRGGQLDAALLYWPYVARLKAAGFRNLIDVADVLNTLGIAQPVALVGYVFRADLAARRPQALAAFFRAVAKTNRTLAFSDVAWDKLRPLMKVESEAEFAALKAGFRGGIPDRLGPPPVADAERLFDILLERGGEKLLGPARRFDPDVFWTPPNP